MKRKRVVYRIEQAKTDGLIPCYHCHRQVRVDRLKSVVFGGEVLIMLCQKCFAYLEPVNRDRWMVIGD